MADELIAIDGGRLNRRRRARGWSKTVLAAQAGLSFRVVKCALDGKPVGLSSASKLANAVGLSVRSLIVEAGAVGAGDVVDAVGAAARGDEDGNGGAEDGRD